MEFLAQKSGQNARVVVVGFRRRSGSRTATYLLVSIPIYSNAHTLREAALTARVTSRMVELGELPPPLALNAFRMDSKFDLPAAISKLRYTTTK